MRRSEIRKLFRRHRGAAAEISRTLGVTPVTISLWLRGKRKSARLDTKIAEYARRLLAREAQEETIQEIAS